ncbi:MAG: hypothetical protein QXF11_02555 [Candidatus Hadarchaeales archaeon]
MATRIVDEYGNLVIKFLEEMSSSEKRPRELLQEFLCRSKELKEN